VLLANLSYNAVDMAGASAFTAFYRSSDGVVVDAADPIMLKRALADTNGLLWADLLIRSKADTAVLRDVFDFHPLTIEDCFSPEVEPAKIDDHGDYIFIVVQALHAYHPGRELESLEVDFYLGPNYVVSCHREPVAAIERFQERCRKDEYVLAHMADWLLHGLLDAIVDEYLPVVDAMDDTIDELEEALLSRSDSTALQQLMMMKRNTLRLRRAVTPQRDIMSRLSRGEYPKLVREDTVIYYRDIYDHLVRVEHFIESLRDLAEGTLNAYLSVVSNRLNEVMKVLAVAAAVFLPLTLISGIYGMNFRRNQFPGFNDPWGFAAVVVAMVAIAVGFLVYFRLRRWI